MTDQASEPLLTVVTATVEASNEAELVDGFRWLLADPLPDGVLRTELFRSVGADHAHEVFFVAAGAYPGSPD